MGQYDRRKSTAGFIACVMTGLLLCCGGNIYAAAEEGSVDEIAEEEDTTEAEEAQIETIIPSAVIAELEEGLSVVRFDGNDGFVGFLQSGGAESDTEVVQYLTENLLSGEIEFQFPDSPFGCSTVSAEGENGERLFGRNFDWYTCDALIVESHPDQGYASLSTVNTDFISQSAGTLGSFFLTDDVLVLASLYAPLDGMNEMGLCVSVNMIEDSDTIDQNTDQPDITTTTAVRLILNQAADVEEAVGLLEEYDMHASLGYMVHLALSDAEGRSVVIEYVDNEMVVTDTSVVTNFYLAEGEKNGIGTEQSHTRFELLQELLPDDGQYSPEEIRDALERVSKHNFNDGETTEWSIIYNQTLGEAVYYHREDYSNAYRIELG